MRIEALIRQIKCIVLAMAVAGSARFANGVDLQTNQVVIDGQIVEGQVVNSSTNIQLLAVSNQLVLIQSTISYDGTVDLPKPEHSSLRLLLAAGQKPLEFGTNGIQGNHGLNGLMYTSGGSGKRTFVDTNFVDMWASMDNARIIVMVADNGPIYSSTNSGMTWTAATLPGEYRFPLDVDENGGGFIVAATIHPSAKNQAIDHFATTWYTIGFGPDRDTLILTEDILDISQAAPALSIASSNGQAIVSWPSGFTNYVLQVSGDLASTNWEDVTNPVNTAGPDNQVVVPSPEGNAFYRLRLR